MNKDSFVFYRSFAEAIDDLPDQDQLIIYRAIKNYALNLIEPELSGISLTLWKLIKPQLAANNKRYKDGTKGAEYGKLGGRPPKETPNENDDNPTRVAAENPSSKTKETPNENVNENVNENENEKENGGSFYESPQKESKPPELIPDKLPETKEDIGRIFEEVRKFWNTHKPLPECRDLITNIPGTDISDVIRTLQQYTLAEIKNAIENYHWHKTRECGEGYVDAPPFGRIYGFLKTGVASYFDDATFKAQYKKQGGLNGGKK